MSARQFLGGNFQSANTTGVYALFISGVLTTLTTTSYDLAIDGQPLGICGHTHVYTGESFGVWSRVRDHLQGNIHLSNLRGTLLAILLEGDFFGQNNGPIDVTACETALTDYLLARTLVAYKLGGLVKEEERRILGETPSPMNIEGRASTPYIALIKKLRKKFYGRPEIVEARRASSDPSFLSGGMISRRPRR